MSQSSSSQNDKNIQQNAENPNIEAQSRSKYFETFQHLGRKAGPGITVAILGLIGLLAFLIRIFSVIRYESVIHEFDPWFNYRVTQFLTKEGAYAFWNWYDPESWYPLGRIIGGTTYPGLMFTSTALHWLANTFLFPVDIRNVCVFLAPVFASLTAVTAYYFVKEVTGRSDSGLLSALFIAIVPGYISRSVAGSYDNEAVAIFALITTFYFFIKAINSVKNIINLGIYYVVKSGLTDVLLHGCCLGRLCLYYQLNPSLCPFLDYYWKN